MEPRSDFQRKIVPDKHYTAQEIRELVLESFPPGPQALRNEEPRDVRFKGMAFVRNSRLNRDYYQEAYRMSQFGEESREATLERLIPGSFNGKEDWVTIVEYNPREEPVTSTFDFINYFECGGFYMFRERKT